MAGTPMRLLAKLTRNERFEMNWQRLLVQGLLILLTGLTFAFASIMKSDAVVMSARFFSWLPVCGMIIMALGILECLDALFSKDLRDFIQRLHVGVLDTIVGTFLLFGVSETPERLSLMIAVYLLVRSIVRLVLAYTLSLPHAFITVFCGLTCITLGLMAWLGWPTKESWFLALSLSIEITFRGIAMMFFAFWIKQQNDSNEMGLSVDSQIL
jgi:uncharacterized membrane protein HdeD (DUF308 family)